MNRNAGFTILAGLPPDGPPAVPCPKNWGQGAREGFVVRFDPAKEESWVANFSRGLADTDAVLPFGDRFLVVAGGALYLVDAEQPGPKAQIDGCVTDILIVSAPVGFVFGWNNISLGSWTLDGPRWKTRRLSWDGFHALRIERGRILGEGWSAPDGEWVHFEVDLESGEASGGPTALSA